MSSWEKEKEKFFSSNFKLKPLPKTWKEKRNCIPEDGLPKLPQQVNRQPEVSKIRVDSNTKEPNQMISKGPSQKIHLQPTSKSPKLKGRRIIFDDELVENLDMKRPKPQNNSLIRQVLSTNNRSSSDMKATSYLGPNGIRMYPVHDLVPPKFAPLFPFTHFNEMQSQLYDNLAKSDDNLVISAPTSSGKTACFMLAILHALFPKDYNGSPSGTVVYITPTKALCQQLYDTWLPMMKKSRLSLGCVTGDSTYNVKDFKSHIVLSTPEKFDVCTRLWKNGYSNSFVKKLKLVCLDEVHLLNQDRGSVLEAIVSRIKLLNQSGLSCRIMAVSATIPNLLSVSSWLGGSQFEFGNEYRPIPLESHVFGYTRKDNVNDFMFLKCLEKNAFDVIAEFSDHKPTLVFVCTRKETKSTATTLCKLGKERHYDFISTSTVKHRLQSAASNVSDQGLKKCLVEGIGIHHAGLKLGDRRIVETLMQEGMLQVLCATSTLCLGVNFPCRLVVIKGTMKYETGNGYVPYDALDVIQMVGRSGRKGMDDRGISVILTSTDQQNYFEKLVKNQNPIESSLLQKFSEHLNSEIACGSICSISQSQAWALSTFLFIRMTENPQFYGIAPNNASNFLKDLTEKQVNQLIDLSLCDIKGSQISPTPLGISIAKFYVSIDTVSLFKGELSNVLSFSDFLLTVCKAKELQQFRFRLGEKKVLNGLNKGIRFRIKGRIKTIEEKVCLLIQSILGNQKIDDFFLAQQASGAMRELGRVCQVLKEYAELTKHFKLLFYSYSLSKMVRNKLWWDEQHDVLKQIENIGQKRLEKLHEASIIGFDDVRDTNAHHIDRILGVKSSSIGKTIIDFCGNIPKFQVEKSLEAIPNTSNVKLNLDIAYTRTLNSNSVSCLLLIGSKSELCLISKFMINGYEGVQNFQTLIDLSKMSKQISIKLMLRDIIGGDYEDNIPLPKQKSRKKVPKENFSTQLTQTQNGIEDNNALTMMQRKRKASTNADSQKRRKVEFPSNNSQKVIQTPKPVRKPSVETSPKRQSTLEESFKHNKKQQKPQQDKPLHAGADQCQDEKFQLTNILDKCADLFNKL